MHHAPATCVAVAATAAAAAAAATVTTTTAAAAAAIADADSSAVPDREGIRAALTAARGRFAAAAPRLAGDGPADIFSGTGGRVL